MILTKYLKIKTSNKNITHYKNLGYDVKSGDEITITPEQLFDNSKNKILVKCDNCSEEYNIMYHSYFRNVKNNLYFCKKCNFIRFKETSMKLYGTEHPLQNINIKEKQKNTNFKKYGVEYVGQSDEIKNKIKQTCINKYGVEYSIQNEEIQNKKINTNVNRYGTPFPTQNIEIKNKIKQTCLDKYGTSSPLASNEIKEKIYKTKELKYGNGKYNNRKKYKQKCLEIYGFDNPLKNNDIKEKIKLTNLNKYGHEYAIQNNEIFNKMLKSGLKIKKYKNIYYQGQYELDFLKKYYNIGITRGMPIEYIYNGKKHIYYPDFYYEKLNLLIEIKSSMWYNAHLEKNLVKKKWCNDKNYNFIFIIDKNYDVFDRIIKNSIYDKQHCWQYDIRINSNVDFIPDKKLKISDFTFEYVPKTDKNMCNSIVKFIEKYEWLGKMPNRPTHRFIAKYKNELAGVVIMATPNSFSNLMGKDMKNLEKLISRGACANWTPKNLASSLIMWSIRWMVKNTQFRFFTAYSDTEAKELGTIYQACNFFYLGKNYGGTESYFDLNNPELGWFSSRNFHRFSTYKKYSKLKNIPFNYKKVIDIPKDVRSVLDDEIKKYKNDCIKKKSSYKHKYVYILGEDKRETKKLKEIFFTINPKVEVNFYPKDR